jgi:hypothetical protein
MAISIATLLVHNRYITDPLTSLKAFDASLLSELALEAEGVDLEAELITKLAALRVFVLELPVEYTPRRRTEGKKITVRDGLRVLRRLVLPGAPRRMG